MYPSKPSSTHGEGSRTSALADDLRRFGPQGQFLGLASVGLLGVFLLVSAVTGDVSLMSLGAGLGLFALAMSVALLSLMRTYPHDTIGWCNTVTAFRLMLVAVLTAWLVQGPDAPWIVFSVAALAFVSDGLDGWLARREGNASDFGARFDMEVDSLFAMVLALMALQSGNVAWFVLLLGLPRYLFFVAQISFPWLNGELPPRFSRKVVCVLQIGVLIILLLPGLTLPVTNALVITVLTVIVWSFWVDVCWLKRTYG